MPADLNAQLQLAIDTSSRLTSLCIARGTDVLASLAVRTEDRRSERLWSEIDFMFRETGLSVDDIAFFSVCTGPGGFTGIRVGMAAAKGLAMARGRLLIGVTALEAVAAAAGAAPEVLAITRAHQGEVFSQLFRVAGAEAPEAQGPPIVSLPDEALERAAGINRLIIIGDGASDNADLIERFGANKSARRRRDWILRPSPDLLAPLVARVALTRYGRGDSGDVTACYVRAAQAETRLALGLVGPGLRK